MHQVGKKMKKKISGSAHGKKWNKYGQVHSSKPGIR